MSFAVKVTAKEPQVAQELQSVVEFLSHQGAQIFFLMVVLLSSLYFHFNCLFLFICQLCPV